MVLKFETIHWLYDQNEWAYKDTNVLEQTVIFIGWTGGRMR